MNPDRDIIIIAIAGVSDLVYEGLSSLLMKATSRIRITRMEDVEALNLISPNHLPGIVIADEDQVRNRSKQFQQLRCNFSSIQWIAFVHSLPDSSLSQLFSDTIFMNDSEETIRNKIFRNAHRSAENENSSGREQLSDRETEVLRLLIEGKSNKEIAASLNISTHTVISHRKNIGQKTGIKSQAGLTIYAITHNIVSLDSL